MSKRDTWVVPFYRASIHISPELRRLFKRDLPQAEFVNLLADAEPVFRQNFERLLVAATYAEQEGAKLLFVEGWASNRIVRANGIEKRVTGSYVFKLLIRLLRRRKLTAFSGAVYVRDYSCCTWEEIEGVLSVVKSDARVIAVAGCPCPSAARVRVTANALLRKHRSRSIQFEVRSVGRPSWVDGMIEAPNWCLHFVTRFGCFFTEGLFVFEKCLARKLRR